MAPIGGWRQDRQEPEKYGGHDRGVHHTEKALTFRDVQIGRKTECLTFMSHILRLGLTIGNSDGVFCTCVCISNAPRPWSAMGAQPQRWLALCRYAKFEDFFTRV